MVQVNASEVKRICVSIVLAMVLVSLAVASAAGTANAEEAPRWALTAVPTPTNIKQDSPTSQVEELTIDATGGRFTLGFWYKNLAEVNHPTTSSLPYNATASEVEAALNGVLEYYGAEVNVSGGPGATAPFRIAWVDEAEDKNLAAALRIERFAVDSHELTGGMHTATLSTLTTGASPAQLILTATNVGGKATDGNTIMINDTLPSGLEATSVKGELPYTPTIQPTCSPPPAVSCTVNASLDPGAMVTIIVTLKAGPGLPASLGNESTVSGGGGAPVTVSTTLPVSGTEAPFGVAPGSFITALSTMQAGAHANVTTAFRFTTYEPTVTSENPRDLHFDLPPGLVGNTVGLPRCGMNEAINSTSTASEGEKTCPLGAIVGAAEVTIASRGHEIRRISPVYNIYPAPGEPAAFAFRALIVPVRLDTTVLSNGNYGVRVTVPEISEAASLIESSVTMWGVPADHNGPGQDISFNVPGGTFGGPGQSARIPLLSSPQQCSEPLSSIMGTDQWTVPGNFLTSEVVPLGTLEGCNKLRLSAKFSMVPDTLEAGAPAGYHFDLTVPQNESPDGLATPNVKKVTLKLPVGTVVNPSAAWGLNACSYEQFYGAEGGPRHPVQESAGEAECPREAQVGTVWIKTPALEEALEGQVYLAEPECHPCTPEDAADGRMVKLYVQAVSEGAGGIVIKLEGKAMIDQATGQITTVFENNPQLPFDEFKLKLSGGTRAVLANPRNCGPATSSMDLTPWSTPFTPDSTPNYTFEINEGCFGSRFDPSFVAGSPNIQSGAYSPFTLSFGRSDNDEFLAGIKQTMPPGLLGNLSTIPLCKEPQAAQGTCDAGSLIGHVQVLTGPGANPFLVSGGQVFLTEGYKGAPYGLSIVVPAVAGPYTLSGTTGKGTVVVRAKIEVDPVDAHLTVTSDPLPTVLDGIPLQLKAVNVTIDRPDFTFNPTSCAKMSIGAVLSSSEGMSATKSSSFQVTNCASLAFEPTFTASTSGKTSRTEGASLDVRLTYPNGAFGKDANVRSVKVELPKRLPSRLTTLQKACPAATFEANPASCPAASMIGSATATTPIIPVSLAGPAYFVSYGGAKFPELVIVLQGYGVTVQLHGETFISKAGITSSTFPAIPDVPVQSFELKLPEGPDSALAAIGNLCTSGALKMPTTFTAQNGTTLNQNTTITPTGCPKHKNANHKRKAKHKAKHSPKAKHTKGKGKKR